MGAYQPQHFLSFFPLPHEQGWFPSLPCIFGFCMTGVLASTTFACCMNRRGDLPGNNLFRRNVLARDAKMPAAGSMAPIPVVVANRSIFAVIESIQCGLPTDSTYRRNTSSAASAGDPRANQSRRAWQCFEYRKSRSWPGDSCLVAKAAPRLGTPFTL